MPSIYKVSGARLWNVDDRVELGGTATPADVQLVKFLVMKTSQFLEEHERLPFTFEQNSQPLFSEIDREATTMYQEHYRGNSFSPLTPDGMVSKMRYGNVTYGNNKVWTICRLQIDYCNLINGHDPDNIPEPAEVNSTTVLMLNDEEMPGDLRASLIMALAAG